MDYNAPSGSTDTNADYVGATASTIGSKIPPNAPMLTQREIVAAERAAGLTPTNADRTQLAQSIGRGVWIGSLGANPNALTGAIGAGLAGAVLSNLSPWTRFTGIATQTNTTASVLITIAGIGSAAGSVSGQLLRRDGSALAIGDVPVGCFDLRFDGTNFRIVAATVSEIGALAAAAPAVQALTPAGSAYASAFTSPIALNDFPGGSSGSGPFAVAQSLTITGATYAVIDGRVGFKPSSAGGVDCRARIRYTIQGKSAVIPAPYQGCRPYSGTQIPVSVSVPLRGLDPIKSVFIELLVDRFETDGTCLVQDARLTVQHNGNP